MWATSLVWLFLAQTYIIPGRPPAAPPAGCSEVTETTWDNLTGWTQSGTAYTADATNDELDFVGPTAGNAPAIRYDTGFTTAHCSVICINTGNQTGDFGTGVVLRADASNGNVYMAQEWGGFLGISRYAWGGAWQCDWPTGNYDTAATVEAGDCLGACITGTSTSSQVEIWFWDESSPPGNCRSDWGAATETITSCGTGGGACCKDTGTLVGIGNENSTGINMSFDNFIGNIRD